MQVDQKRVVLKQRFPGWNIDRFSDRQIGAMYEKYCTRRGQVPDVRPSSSTYEVFMVDGRRVVRTPSGMEFFCD